MNALRNQKFRTQEKAFCKRMQTSKVFMVLTWSNVIRMEALFVHMHASLTKINLKYWDPIADDRGDFVNKKKQI
jgi:hypothetical protein